MNVEIIPEKVPAGFEHLFQMGDRVNQMQGRRS